MDWQQLDSPTIDAIAHESGRLRVRLTKGRIYEYDSVPESVFNELLTTNDPDTFYGLNVRGEYPSKKIRSTSKEQASPSAASASAGSSDLIGALMGSLELAKAKTAAPPTPPKSESEAPPPPPVPSSNQQPVVQPVEVPSPESARPSARRPELTQTANPAPPSRPPETLTPAPDLPGTTTEELRLSEALMTAEAILRSGLRTLEELHGKEACRALLSRLTADFGLASEPPEADFDTGVLDRFVAVRLRQMLSERPEWEALCDFTIPSSFEFKPETTAVELARKTARWVEEAEGCLALSELAEKELYRELDLRECAGVVNALGATHEIPLVAVAPGFVFLSRRFDPVLAELEKALPTPCQVTEAVDKVIELTSATLTSEMAEELLYRVWGATDADVRGEATFTRYRGEETVSDRIKALLNTYPEGLDEVEEMYAMIFPEHRHDDVVGWLEQQPEFSRDRQGYWKLRCAQASAG